MKNFHSDDYVIRTTNARFDQGVVWIFFFSIEKFSRVKEKYVCRFVIDRMTKKIRE